MAKLIKLDCGAQHYEWGKLASDSFVARMKRETHSDKKYAELWVGTHINCPSKTHSGQLLADFLSDPFVAQQFFSPAHRNHKEFRGKVPFLLKVLSIRTALSIQAHPSKRLAEKLHRENPSKYKDANHKPELIIALTPFQALCRFRSLSDIIRSLSSVRPLKAILKGDMNSSSGDEKELIKKMMRTIYSLDAKDQALALRAHASDLKAKGDAACTVEDRLFLLVMSQFPDDIGCWMVYFLNYVRLEPGQGLFLSDSEPHAYIYGDGVEIMACSDNVVRAGLTPKWKDVPTLLSMLNYGACGLEQVKYERKLVEPGRTWEIQYYCPPSHFPDFSIYRLQHMADDNENVTVELPTIGLGFCLGGCGTVNGIDVSEGDCFAVPYGKLTCKSHGPCLIFVASTNILTQESKI